MRIMNLDQQFQKVERKKWRTIRLPCGCANDANLLKDILDHLVTAHDWPSDPTKKLLIAISERL